MPNNKEEYGCQKGNGKNIVVYTFRTVVERSTETKYSSAHSEHLLRGQLRQTNLYLCFIDYTKISVKWSMM